MSRGEAFYYSARNALQLIRIKNHIKKTHTHLFVQQVLVKKKKEIWLFSSFSDLTLEQ